MKNNYFILIIIFIGYFHVCAQEIATTTNGKQVMLHADGTWEAIETDEEKEVETTDYETSHIFIGGQQLLSGVTKVIHEEEEGMTTSVTVAKNSSQTILIFWQETKEQNMNFFDEVWTGKVLLYLANGESISLLDRNMKGQNKIKGNDRFSETYQRYAAYYLSPADCIKLKRHILSRLAYKTNSHFVNGTEYIDIVQNADAIKNQLISIKR